MCIEDGREPLARDGLVEAIEPARLCKPAKERGFEQTLEVEGEVGMQIPKAAEARRDNLVDERIALDNGQPTRRNQQRDFRSRKTLFQALDGRQSMKNVTERAEPDRKDEAALRHSVVVARIAQTPRSGRARQLRPR